MATNKTEEKSKDGLALVVGGIFILSLVFATYNYFNKGDELSDIEKISNETVFEDENSSENSMEGDLNGDGISTSEGLVYEFDQESSIEWVANNYSEGEIQGASYTVVSGDTLWEIAEAAYGNGAEWTKILNANSNNIGFLANGAQALIVPGQVLILP